MNKKYLLLAVFIGILVVLNVSLLTQSGPARACYKNACIIGEKDPVAEMKALLASSKDVIILMEGDASNSQKNHFIDGAFIQLSNDFGNKNKTLVAVGFENGIPVSCTCERQVNATGFVNCTAPLVACISMAPGESTVLLKLSYPSFADNLIVIQNRTIDFQGKSGEDTYALVTEVFDKLR